MSLKTSQSMPVENYSVVQQSENGTQFGPNTKIRFRIGSHLGYIDFHTSYLQWNLEIQNAKAKMEFTNDMGADVLIRTWRVLIGGHIVEEIDHPNVLLKTIKYDYGQDLGMTELCEVLDKAGNGTGYQGLNKSEYVDITTENPCAIVKCILDLNFSGVFGSASTFPVGLTGDVEIEITLEDQRKCFQVIRSGIEPQALTTNGWISRGIVLNDQDWLQNSAARDVTVQDINNIEEATNNSGGEYFYAKASQAATGPAQYGAGPDRLRDSPFNPGQGLEVTGERNAVQYISRGANANNILTTVTSSAANPGIVTLTGQNNIFPAGNTTDDVTEVRCSFNTTGVEGGTTPPTKWDNNGQLTYEISVPSLVLQVVVPPQQYVAEQSQKVATEGFSIDIPTYTLYKTNTFAGVKSATIEIPCYSSRARGIICIGVDGRQALGGNACLVAPFDMGGCYDDLSNYQFQIGEQREPVRPVDCGNLSTYQQNVAQEQLTELEKALRACGCNVRSLRKHARNFVVGRALSAYGGTIPLTMKGARIYLDYLQENKRALTAPHNGVPVIQKNWYNYCHHIRRLNITPQGVQVMM
jgi:hypothetical protein